MSSTRSGLQARFSGWTQSQSQIRIGWALAIFATISFSMAPPLVRFAIVDGFDPTTLLLLRMLIASTMLGLTLAAMDWRKLQMSRRGVASSTLVGAINAAGMMIFFTALSLLEASLASMILALSPPIVLSLLALRGERLTQRHLVRLTLALIGVYLLVGPTGEVNWLGAGLALLATFLF
ncbi:MAG: EamA family transporter [Caldilinea sp.]